MPNEETQLDKDVEAILTELGDNHDAELLDELVHDAASNIASSVNNEGFAAQVRFLVEQFGKDEALKEIRDALK